MDHYIDLHFQADEEVPIYFIRNKVFAKLHKALYELEENTIGISFPNYKTKLGDILRIHGEQSNLTVLQQKNWLGGLAGYCDVGEVLLIPVAVKGYRTISRVRSNMSNAKLQRLKKRGSITVEEMKRYDIKMIKTFLTNPYLELESTSNGHKHRRYLQFGVLVSEPVVGKFDSFGLSKTATVPWF